MIADSIYKRKDNHMKKLLLVVLSFTLVSLAAAQDWSAQRLLADPDKNLGKKVSLLIYKVDVPAINVTADVDFRDFSVYTAKRINTTYESGGYITVRVSREEASSFTQKYGTSTDYKNAKHFLGVFRSENGAFLVDATVAP
jgi:hypothetical protein